MSAAIRQSDRRSALPEHATQLHLDAIKRFVDDNLHDESFCLEAAAALLGRHPRTLNKLFEAEGESFMRWTWNRRLDRANALLHYGDPSRSITEVAFSCGFKNVSHFSRAFRGRFGIAPSAAARMPRRDEPH